MKIKADFVTNSSSASFNILKSKLTKEQIIMIYNHMEVGEAMQRDLGYALSSYDEWQINENKHKLMGYTSMDNFDMFWFLREIGVDPKDLNYDKND